MNERIQLKLYATLARFAPPAADAYSISPGTTVDELVDRLALPRKDVKIVFVNGRKAAMEKRLQDGDRVGIFPPVGGG